MRASVVSASGFVVSSPSVRIGITSASNWSSVLSGAPPRVRSASSTARWRMKNTSRSGPRSPRTTSASSPVEGSGNVRSWLTTIVRPSAEIERIVNFPLFDGSPKPNEKNCIPAWKLCCRKFSPVSAGSRMKAFALASTLIHRRTPVSAGEVGSPGKGAVKVSYT